MDIFEMNYVPMWEAVLRIVLATVAALLIGLERQYKHKPLDLRPYALVALGSCLAVITIMELSFHVGEADLNIDPAKVIGGILGGIGFIGAGALFRSDGEVHGGATAASVWVMGTIGVAFGLGAYALATLATALAFGTLMLGSFISYRAGESVEDSPDTE